MKSGEPKCVNLYNLLSPYPPLPFWPSQVIQLRLGTMTARNPETPTRLSVRLRQAHPQNRLRRQCRKPRRSPQNPSLFATMTAPNSATGSGRNAEQLRQLHQLPQQSPWPQHDPSQLRPPVQDLKAQRQSARTVRTATPHTIPVLARVMAGSPSFTELHDRPV